MLKVRYVGEDILLDYTGMNPASASIFGFKEIANDEILILEGLEQAEKDETIRHEQNEYELIKSGLSYWEAHKRLMSREAKAMPVKEMVRKVFTTVIKDVGDRVLEFTGSTESSDRDKEIVMIDGWQLENYLKNPVVLWAHNYADPPIGKAVSVRKIDKNLVFQVKFASSDEYEFADTIYKLCKGGFLNATSVGFIPIDWEQGKTEKEPSRIYKKQELLELSIVPVPSNPDALRNAVTSNLITTKEFDFVTKPEVTENYVRIPNPKDKESHEGCKIRTIDITSGVKGLYCIDHKVIMTYLFDKEKFSKEEAENWVKEHSKSITQDEIKDELDFSLQLIKKWDFNDENQALAKVMHDELTKRFPGSDRPVDIKTTPSIRSLLDIVTKSNDAHHKAHEECYQVMNECFTKMCKTLEDGDIGNQPSQDFREQPQNLSQDKEKTKEFLKQEIIKQLNGGLK